VTRDEHKQLTTVFGALTFAMNIVKQMLLDAQRDLDTEDEHQSAQEENSNLGAAHDKFKPL